MAGRPEMPLTDTPPQSPLSPIDHLGRPRMRIHIDDRGVHDFDLRKEQGGPKKLKKFSRRSQPSISSIEEMRRTPSDGSDTASIRKRLSLLMPGKNELQKTISTRSAGSSVEIRDDPLPDTKKELEIRLNYHLSELDMLKKTINAANDVIRQHCDRYQILQTRSTTDMTRAMQVQEDLITQARRNRDSWVDFVSFHRRQLERIKHKRIEIETEAGLEPSLPQVYKQMWGDEDWGRLFMI